MKKVLVTGASRGIGAAIARALAGDGWHVIINYLESHDKARSLAEEIGGEAICCDVADAAAVRAMFEKIGPVDALVSNAGIAWSGLLPDMSDAEWERIVSVNLGGAFNCCRAAIPGMVHNKAGSIVCISSILAVLSFRLRFLERRMWNTEAASVEAMTEPIKKLSAQERESR